MSTPKSAIATLDCPEKDHEFLLKGDVFMSDFLDMWVSAWLWRGALLHGRLFRLESGKSA
jgi:hypothetical protein